MLKLPQLKVVPTYTPFSGGLDLVTPTIESKPGMCRSSQNVYQDHLGGYRTLEGYERYSGQPAPSAASYSILEYKQTTQIFDGTVEVMDGASFLVDGYGAIDQLWDDDTPIIDGPFVLVDGYSRTRRDLAAAGSTLANVDLSISAIILDVLDNQLIITKATGTFLPGNLLADGLLIGSTDGEYGMTNTERDAYYKSLAANEYREDIGEVPGAGAVLGIWYYGGKWYAFRDAVNGLSAAMFVEDTDGWEAVPLGMELAFTSGGATEIVANQTITGATSNATAVVTRVVLESGTWAGGDAAGKFIMVTKVGNFVSENINVGAGINLATIGGNATAITLAPDGTYEFVNAGFTGSADSMRMYGVNGVNRGWEFDDTVFVPISTGMTTDTPSHVYEHKNHLCYSYLWSFQHSSLGFPYQWSSVTGGDEIGMGDTITNFVSLPGSEDSATLAIFSRNRIGMLYGTSSADWQLIGYKREAGAIASTVQLIGNVFMMDDRGVTKLTQSQSYGNFEDATVSKLVQPWLVGKKALVRGSCVVREKNQYWLFFSDKTAMCFTIKDGEVSAAMPMLFAHEVTCVCSAETVNGEEVVMVGCSDGHVRRLFSGTSFDGEMREWFFESTYDHFKTPTTTKRFRKGTFEVAGDGYASFAFAYELEFGNDHIQQPVAQLYNTDLKVEYWDSFVWDQFFWDGQSLAPAFFRMDGSGTSMSIMLQGRSTYHNSVRFSGAIVQYSPTREVV